MPSVSFTGIVLAGGRSSRMGRDKAMLEIDGRSLLDVAISGLRDAGAARVVVSGTRPAHAGVPDTTPGLGPVGGLATVLAACEDGSAVIVPVDMPHLPGAAISALIDTLASARAAYFHGHPLPCALTVDAGARATLQAMLADRPAGPSMHAALRALGGVSLPLEDASGFAGVNTPADWAALIA